MKLSLPSWLRDDVLESSQWLWATLSHLILPLLIPPVKYLAPVRQVAIASQQRYQQERSCVSLRGLGYSSKQTAEMEHCWTWEEASRLSALQVCECGTQLVATELHLVKHFFCGRLRKRV